MRTRRQEDKKKKKTQDDQENQSKVHSLSLFLFFSPVSQVPNDIKSERMQGKGLVIIKMMQH